MKMRSLTLWCRLLCLGAVLCAGMLAAMTPPPEPQAAPAAPGVSTAVKDIGNGCNDFALKMLTELSKSAATENVFFSPFSVHVALAMTFAGAGSDTLQEMQKVLGYPLESGSLAQTYKAYLESLRPPTGAEAPYELAVANAIWAQGKYPFGASYLKKIEDWFASKIHLVDFAANANAIRVEINTWVEKITHDRIKDLIPSGMLSADTRMVLVNAVYFKGKWQDEFLKSDTRDEPFTTGDGSPKTVPMMSRTANMLYAETEQYQALRLPYKGKDLAMLVFLPREKNGIDAMIAGLDADKIAETGRQFTGREVQLFLPKFTTDYGCTLNDPLQQLGMKAAFTESADFSGMFDGGKSPTGAFYISAIVHKAFVAVDEEGTEAAAATAVAMTQECVMERVPPVVFRADHPFLFAIMHLPSETMLFVGRVMKP
ncbi:MAG TPA: serpin family protein [Candidatus Ozemobacteraceae bacterium]|nr:serpin family protein [Candidatus Ozemobacteraceae bacterium]